MSLSRLLLTLVALCAAVTGSGVQTAAAHEVNPAYLELTETSPGSFEIVWKQPVRDGRRLRLTPQFPADCRAGESQLEAAGAAVIERWMISCPLSEGELRIEGLQRTLTDVFVRLSRLDAPEETAVLRPNAPALDLSEPAAGTALGAYFRLGVEHILFGFDHLLFVLGLCLIVAPRNLLWTVTAFSLSHSLTLALSALAGITLPGPPVEAVIALSIILLAREALERLAGRETLASRKPWLIAFGFGLIHGFGFAGALSEIGLPKSQEVWALLLFNLGVEAGQILFVAAVFLLAALLWRLAKSTRTPSRAFAAYFIGTAGTFWLIERLTSFPPL